MVKKQKYVSRLITSRMKSRKKFTSRGSQSNKYGICRNLSIFERLETSVQITQEIESDGVLGWLS